MSQGTVSAPAAGRISQATFDLLARAWRENRTIYEVLTALGIAGEYRQERLDRWGGARPRKPPVEEGRPGPSGYGGLAWGGQLRRPELGVAFTMDGVNDFRGYVGDPRWCVSDTTCHERAMPHRTPEGDVYRFERVLNLERTLQEHNALDDMPALGAVRPWEYTSLVGVRGHTWVMWIPSMPIPSRYGTWPLGGQRPCAPGDHGPRPLDLWVGRHLEGWCERLADEAGIPLTEEERAGVRRAADLWSEGRHFEIMAGRPPRARAIINAELFHTGISYGDPYGRGQIAWLIYSGPESDRVGSAREWARAQLAADIADALQT